LDAATLSFVVGGLFFTALLEVFFTVAVVINSLSSSYQRCCWRTNYACAFSQSQLVIG
jgi:hypothetical protein